MGFEVMKKFQPSSFFPVDAFKCYEFNQRFMADHPEYFYPEGTTVFCGPQGSGKTISAVRMVQNIVKRFPQCVICSNIDFHFVPEGQKQSLSGVLGHKGAYVPYEDLEQLIELQNGYAGVLYVLDEMHLLFNSLQSKDMPLEVFQEVSQQRKQRKCIVGTSQVFMRLAKPFREQIGNVVLCRTLFKYFQLNTFIDGTTAVEKDGQLDAVSYGTKFFFHSPALYESYDTYAKVKVGQGFSTQIYNNSLDFVSPVVAKSSGKGKWCRFGSSR